MSGYPRRSNRAITSTPQQYNQFVPAASQQQATPAQNFPAYSTGYATAKPQPQVPTTAPPPPPPQQQPAAAAAQPTPAVVENPKMEQSDPTDVSATTKALAAMDEDVKEKRWKKGVRAPAHIRRKRMNRILARVASPKSAIMLLHEMKPGCVYNLTQTSYNPCVTFHAVVAHDGVTLGNGNGNSKAAAKANAAEDAIRNLVSKIVLAQKSNQSENGSSSNVDQDGDESMDISEEREDVPWSGLAAFAMYKLFTEWHQQGVEVPVKGNEIKPIRKPAVDTAEAKEKRSPKVPPVLPPNPLELHPCELLNRMIPELQVVELERKMDPPHSVTVAYNIEGEQHKGTATNKKNARKEAAKAACAALFGVIFP